jgi:hypothetical protein
LTDGESVPMQGSGSKPYALENVGGVYSCTCPAWRNQSVGIERRTCKHLRKLRGDAAEEARRKNCPMIREVAAVYDRGVRVTNGDFAPVAGRPIRSKTLPKSSSPHGARRPQEKTRFRRPPDPVKIRLNSANTPGVVHSVRSARPGRV